MVKEKKKMQKKTNQKGSYLTSINSHVQATIRFPASMLFFFFIYSITTEISKSVFKIINLCIMLDYFKDEPFFYMHHVYELVADIA